jgi:hypothetical protein
VSDPSERANSQPSEGQSSQPSAPTAADRYQIFEQVALEKLRSGSDQSKPVVFLPLPVRASAITAVAIAGLGVFWAVLARVPVQVNGVATIVPQGTVISALARADGVLYYQISGIGPERLSSVQQQRNQRLSTFWAQSVVDTNSTLPYAQLEQLALDAMAPSEGEPLVMPESKDTGLAYRLAFDAELHSGGGLANLFVPGNTLVAHIDSPAVVEEFEAIRRLTHPKLSLSRQITQDRRQRSAAYQQIDPLIQRQLRDKRQELLEREQLLVRLKALWRKGYVSAAQLLQEQSNVIGLRQQVVQLDRDRLGNSFSSTDQRQQATEAELNSLQTTDQLQDALVTYMSRVLTIAPPSGGYLVALYQQNGMQVKQGDELFTYSLKAPELPEVIPVFVDAATVQQLDEGMQVLVTPKGISRAQYGGIPGVVDEVGRLPVHGEALAAVAGGRSLAAAISQANPSPYLVHVKLKLANPGRCRQLLSRLCYAWSGRRIPPFPVRIGSQADVQLTTIYRRPIEFVMPALREALGLVVENR